MINCYMCDSGIKSLNVSSKTQVKSWYLLKTLFEVISAFPSYFEQTFLPGVELSLKF